MVKIMVVVVVVVSDKKLAWGALVSRNLGSQVSRQQGARVANREVRAGGCMVKGLHEFPARRRAHSESDGAERSG
jgi:hypothetical protein